MENLALFISISFMFNIMMIIISPFPSFAASTCGGPCQTADDCNGQLICIKGKCNDNPDNDGTHNCTGGGSCKPFGTLICNGKSYPKYNCSPPVTISTRAVLRNNDFSEGGIGGGPPSCDKNYHDNKELVVALSTGWFDRGSRCGKMIRITASNGRSVLAKVVDECDSRRGCDAAHAYLGTCGHNVVNGSDGVWRALGLNTDDERADVTWSMA
ncbi:hypothetical protein FEM48_Zijuj07G0009100 [Ziziphus jujuba var. spinosa]|uniref:Kiwellin-like n=1 Tax=Ziziphus jujuba var. spinosa TaxID=714518 RepID=A0A978V1H7_ZIZJJ|nr:hypothetical protein FEM48_Zijuj07G0009100 [Ziziphus jujuba var. spinosa]